MTVFKAPLIIDKSYYKSKQFFQIITLFSAIGIGLLSNIFQVNIYFVFPIILIAGIGMYLQFRSAKKIESISKNAKVHMNESSIIIFDKNGNETETLDVEVGQHIIVKENYTLAEQDLRASLNEMTGDFHKSYIIVDISGVKKKYEFLFESNYMLVQLKKVIESWRERGVNVTAVD